MTIGVKIEDGVVVNRVVGVPDGYIETDGTPQIGWSYDGQTFTPPTPPELTWDDIRSKRDGLLIASDWTQIADAPLTTEQKAAWATYRQALRDLPQTYETPDDVIWPTQPE